MLFFETVCSNREFVSLSCRKIDRFMRKMLIVWDTRVSPEMWVFTFFNYLQSRGAMNPKLNAFFILLYNFGSDQLSLRSIFNCFL